MDVNCQQLSFFWLTMLISGTCCRTMSHPHHLASYLWMPEDPPLLMFISLTFVVLVKWLSHYWTFRRITYLLTYLLTPLTWLPPLRAIFPIISAELMQHFDDSIIHQLLIKAHMTIITKVHISKSLLLHMQMTDIAWIFQYWLETSTKLVMLQKC